MAGNDNPWIIKRGGSFIMYKKVQAINQLLENQGAKVVQKKPGLGNRPALYGYIPQAVFDAVAQTVEYTNKVNHFEYTEKQAIAQVTVTIGELSHTQFGESQIVTAKSSGFSDIGSALKGAVTDATQKALALFGIGASAYRGELQAVFDGMVSQTITGDDYALLKEEALTLVDRQTSVKWWKEKLPRIQKLEKGDRDELVKILGKLK
jgi:hypothetical protein